SDRQKIALISVTDRAFLRLRFGIDYEDFPEVMSTAPIQVQEFIYAAERLAPSLQADTRKKLKEYLLRLQ
ncbi:MAG: hypothetical protein RQ826_15685, partial [Xanthomonadales bacterium]|nr:hypothetical protein [Xanthomonadales bacterium]